MVGITLMQPLLFVIGLQPIVTLSATLFFTLNCGGWADDECLLEGFCLATQPRRTRWNRDTLLSQPRNVDSCLLVQSWLVVQQGNRSPCRRHLLEKLKKPLIKAWIILPMDRDYEVILLYYAPFTISTVQCMCNSLQREGSKTTQSLATYISSRKYNYLYLYYLYNFLQQLFNISLMESDEVYTTYI